MKFRLIAVGTKMPAWIQTGFLDYLKRLPAKIQFQLIEIPAELRTKSANSEVLRQKESHKILKVLSKDSLKIALVIKGKSWETETLSTQIQQWIDADQDVDLIIGGPDGLSDECISACQIHWSLSALTLPHPVVRIIVIEQIYRAISILQNHPYHR
jgi:23S rRNA (pseudouridine1915-N3)-methyltransferase